MADEHRVDDNIQHGIDDNPNDDAKKGATLGGLGGAAVGAAAGAMTGPIGAVIGAVVGGAVGAGASGAAVGAIDKMDNDNNVTGLGDSVAYENRDDDNDYVDHDAVGASTTGGASGTMGYQNVPGTTAHDHTPGYQTASNTGEFLTGDGRPLSSQTAGPVEGTLGGNQIPGIQTGGTTASGAPDTRGVVEKTTDTLTGDRIDDKTGERIR